MKLPFKMEKQYRLAEWNYSNNGYYFVTICTKDRENYLRNVGTDPCVCASNNKTIGDLTAFGKMVLNWWLKIPDKFKDVSLGEYAIMPNHVHGIVIIKNNGKKSLMIGEERTRGSVPTEINKFGRVGKFGQIIRWFKTMTTNEYIKGVKENNWPKFNKRIWQSRFHDRIIRNEKEYWTIGQYIKNNPKNWKQDRNNISTS